jgi:alpha-ribazole phosphatase
MKVTAVRHTSVNIPANVCYGFTDVALNSTFEAEASIVRKNLSGCIFDKIYSSPSSRCALLADYCGFHCREEDPRIKELNFGDWEMKSWMENKLQAQHWVEDWLNNPIPNGESYAIMQKRVNAFMDDVKSSGNKNICVFTHGGVIRLIHVYLDIRPIEKSFDFPIEYGQIFHFDL